MWLSGGKFFEGDPFAQGMMQVFGPILRTIGADTYDYDLDMQDVLGILKELGLDFQNGGGVMPQSESSLQHRPNARNNLVIDMFRHEKGFLSKTQNRTLPESRGRHCLIELCDKSEILFYGGYSDPAFCTSDYCLEEQRTSFNASRSGFIWRKDQWNKLPDSPCEHSNHARYLATCAIKKSSSGCQVIIPTYDSVNQKRCTAILDIASLTWKEAQNDNNRNALYGGHAISVAENKRVLYLGGLDRNNNELNTIYEFDSELEAWKIFDGPKLPVNVTSRTAPTEIISYFPMHIEHCNTEHAQTLKQKL